MIRGYSIPFLRTFSRGTDPFGLAPHVRLHNMARIYIEDITWQQGDKKFQSSVEKYFTSERSERNFVSPSGHVMLYLLYKHQ